MWSQMGVVNTLTTPLSLIRSSLDHMRREADAGHKRVGELERALNGCRDELKDCLSEVEREKERKSGEHARLDQQVIITSHTRTAI